MTEDEYHAEAKKLIRRLGKDEAVKKMADFPCRHRGDVSLKMVAVCATCEKEVELAMCGYYATVCTVKGSAINGTKSASCAECPQRSQ